MYLTMHVLYVCTYIRVYVCMYVRMYSMYVHSAYRSYGYVYIHVMHLAVGSVAVNHPTKTIITLKNLFNRQGLF